MFGGRDALVPVSAADALGSWMPGVTIEVLADASHALPLERAEEVAGAMLAMISGVRG